MWTHVAWQERFLPQPLPPRERLRAYASWCNAVEGNTTFYATPARATVESWAAQTDPAFRFVVKLPRTVTHDHRLHDVDAEVAAFLTAVEPLGSRLHALWVQLPGSFTPNDLGALVGFLRRMPTSYRLAVEVRHPAFFTDPRAEQRLTAALARTDAEWVPFDTQTLFQAPPTTDAEREAWTKKPRLPRRAVAFTDRPIIRYLGRDDEVATVEGWQWLVDVAGRWLDEGRSPTVFIHTPDNASALPLARRFHDDVRRRVGDLEPLPEPLPAEPLTLF